MTVARSVADVLDRSRGLRGGVDRPDVSQRVAAAAGLRRRGAGLLRRSPRLPLRLDRVDGSDDQGVRRRHPRLRRRPRPGTGALRQGPAQGRGHPAVPGPVHRRARGCCSSAGRRRRPGCGAPNAGTTRRPAAATRGWCAPRRSSTSSTSIAWTPTSARSSSSSAPTSRSPPSCASTATSGPNARPPRPGSGSRRWTTGSPPSMTWTGCRASATAWARSRSTRCCASGCAILPNPFTDADEAAGYRYELSLLQAEFSLTQMLDRPVSGRIFFEQVLHDNLDIGRPDQISLVFDRRIIRKGRHPTPGRFRTRVITDGVIPCLHIDYKNTTVKQYHKEGRALRTETTINDPRDFGLSKRLTNLPALRQIGFTANRRLLGVQRHQPRPDPRRPSVHRPDHPDHHRHRHPHPRTALRRPPRARPAAGPAHPPAATPRVHQP